MKFKFLLAFTVISLSLYSQKSNEYDYGIPLPPESYQFKKRLVNNVSLYTGQPSIDIPIYTINLDGMEIPISISYNTGGIKVEEDATSVGLGWSLNIGGQITRDNHGLPDERYFIHKPYNDPYGVGGLKETLVPNNNGQFNCGTPAYAGRMEFYDNAFRAGDNITTNYVMADSRPDDFFYSFFGHSGKFMFSQELKKFVTFPLDDITIDYEIGTLYTPRYFDNFKVKLPTGYTLILGKDGRSSISYLLGTPFDQSWQLKKIVSPKNKEVTYNYITATYNLYTGLSNPTNHVIVRSLSDFSTASYESNKTRNIETLISEIVFPNGKIGFTYGDRLDLQTGAKKLETISIFDSTGKLIKKIELVQNYFEANQNLFSQDAVNKRLRLNGLRFYDTKNNIVENYNFDYYLFDKIPSKSSKAHDHWGYFNGKTTNTSIFPKNLLPYYYTEQSSLGFNRDIDTSYTKTFSLKSIKFPEGGTKYYNYENHTAVVSSVIGNYYDAISDERYNIRQIPFTVSGYDLKTFIPAPSEVNTFNKVFYSAPFETTIYSKSLNAGDVSILINSNIPFQVPNYRNINAEFNNVQFYLERKQEDGSYTSKYLGTISKNENSSGNINSYFDVGGKGTYRMKFIVTQNYLLSSPSDYNFYHNTSFKIKYRDKVKDDVFVGGLRIKSINTYTNDNSSGPKYTTNFKYLADFNNITSGKMMNIPSYVEYISKFVPNIPMEGQPSAPEVQLGVRLSSSSTLPLYKTSSSNVGYTQVTQIDYDNTKKTEIKEVSFFSWAEPLFSEISLFDGSRENEPKDWHRGKLLKKLLYNNSDVVREENYTYYGTTIEQNMGYVDEINYQLLDNSEFCKPQSAVSKHIYPSNMIPPSLFTKGYPAQFDNVYAANKYSIENSNTFGFPGAPGSFKIPYFKIYTGFDKLKSKTTTDYLAGGSVSQTENYFYNSTPTSIQLSSQTNTNSKGETLETKYYYAQSPEMSNEPVINELLAKNMVAIPLKEESFRNTNKLSEKKTQYASFPSSVINQPNILPQYIYTKKGNVLPDQLERKVTYEKYDNFGNLMQYTLENGIPVSLIWGYSQTLPIAKIENATNAQVAAALGISNINSLNEANLAAINALRNNSALSNCMITTFTHVPLVGVSTITDTKGDTTTYTYDSFGRLEFVKDSKGFILSENQYNYKH